MKFVKRISLFILFPMVMFGLGFLTSMKLEDFFYPGKSIAQEIKYSNSSVYEQPAVPAATEKKQVITADTAYFIEEVDLEKGTSVETQWVVPEQYIGFDRDHFVKAMEEYEQSPSLKDRELGLVSLEVVSFSREKVVVRKNYEYKQICTNFYLVSENHYVVVYCDDMKTVYMNTNIRLENLPEKLQQEIIRKKYVESEEELFNFLETYSS